MPDPVEWCFGDLGRRGAAADRPDTVRRTVRNRGTLGSMTAAGHGYERGDDIDHFIVIEPLGAGGMGAVYAAYDADLDRKVAIKLLAPDKADPDTGTTRLFREARAMARLSHPNVATVYEVGMAGEDVFIAMQLIDGESLAEWIAGGERAVDDVVRVFAAAGRGLEAAHRAGLVHRDFKPGNVMIDASGAVRVLDFGLARPVAHASSSDELSDLREDSGVSVDESITRVGAVLGTPAYMAPEQALGQAVDERTDQFSFCVALFEAIYGERPFEPDALRDLTVEQVDARLREASRAGDVPAHVRRALARGLRPARRDRYPDMTALLADLAPPAPAARGRAIVFASLAIAIVGAAVAMWVARAEPASRCETAAEPIAAVWNDGARDNVREALRASGRAWAGDAADVVIARFDVFARQWAAMRSDACEATHVRGEQSDALLDLRMSCLDRRLHGFAALVDVVSDADQTDLAKAVDAAGAVDDLDACDDADALAAVVPEPDSEAVRERVAALRDRMDRAAALQVAGRAPAALDMVRPLVDEARAVGYDPVLAEALWARGNAASEMVEREIAEADLREAIAVAARSRHDHVAARAWVLLLDVLSEEAKFDDAVALIAAAEAWIARVGAPGEVVVRLHDATGLVHSRRGELDEALESHRRAVEAAHELLGPNHRGTHVATNHLGLILWKRGQHSEALGIFEGLLARTSDAASPYPAGHPHIAAVHNNIGLIHLERGTTEQAVEQFRGALEMWRAIHGDVHERVALTESNLGIAERELGELDDALEHHRRSLAAYEELHAGGEHPEVALGLEQVGNDLWMAGQLDEAYDYLRRALDMREKLLQPKHPRVATGLNNLAGLEAERGNAEEALPMLLRALAIREEVLGAEHRSTAWTLTDLGNVYVELGRHADAVEVLERALRVRLGQEHPNTWSLADTRFHLARALWPDPRQRPRARALTEAAREGYVSLGKPTRGMVETLDAWVRAR